MNRGPVLIGGSIMTVRGVVLAQVTILLLYYVITVSFYDPMDLKVKCQNTK
jgi:hypothetical protein